MRLTVEHLKINYYVTNGKSRKLLPSWCYYSYKDIAASYFPLHVRKRSESTDGDNWNSARKERKMPAAYSQHSLPMTPNKHFIALKGARLQISRVLMWPWKKIKIKRKGVGNELCLPSSIMVGIHTKLRVFSDRIRNLGFIIDSNITMKQRVIKSAKQPTTN